jgi:drug/metabolite transporter (DMT)-like permease
MNAGIRILGLLLLILGIVFIYLGVDLSESFSNRFMKEMAGTYPDETKRYFLWGIVMAVVGAGILAASYFRRKK